MLSGEVLFFILSGNTLKWTLKSLNYNNYKRHSHDWAFYGHVCDYFPKMQGPKVVSSISNNFLQVQNMPLVKPNFLR